MKKKLKQQILKELLIDFQYNKLSDQYLKEISMINRRILLFNLFKTKQITRVAKISNYVEVIKQYTNETFKSHFRMYKSTFRKLLQLVESFWFGGTCRPELSAEISLYITIWRLANRTSTYRDVADRFGVGRGSACRAFKKITKLLASRNIVSKFIKWPTSEQDFQKVIHDFNNLRPKHPFPNVIGCLDSSYIKIFKPKDDTNYSNRKGTPCMILQCVCDAHQRIIDFFFGWTGRSHDADVWRNSPLRNQIENGELFIPDDCHLLGDSAYPLKKYLIVPYKDHGYLTSIERKFNTQLSSTRVCIENAFGLLKGKFKVLKQLPIYKINYAKDIVVTCIVLHNFILNYEKLDEQTRWNFEVEDNVDDLNRNTNQQNHRNINVSRREAIAKRNSLAESFAT